MRNKRNLNHSPFSKLWAWLLVMLLSAPVVEMRAADWMHRADKFSMSTSSDHVTFRPFLCDLDRSNTYAKSGGIYAKCGNEQVWLMDLYYKEEGSDENPYGKVYARYCVGESRAWFTNGYNTAEQKIEFGGKDFLIQKWGGDNHYCTPNIDFYYHASMAGKTWTFYYQYDHNDGGTYTMTLGSAYLSPTLGHSRFNSTDFQYERTGPDKIKFTVPALPDDIASKLSEVHIREGKYKVTLTYTLQDNSWKGQTETFDCQKGSKKTYEITIPAEVGNPKRIDLKVEATDGMKDARYYYWKYTDTYSRSDIFKMVPVPNTLTTEYRQFDNAADLSWKAYPSGSNNYLECKPYVYRMETDKNGKAKSGSWSKRGTVDDAGTNQSLGYHDNNVSTSTYYKFLVLNVPKDWIGNGISESSLNSPNDDLLKRLGYVESEVMNTRPELTIFGLKQDDSVTDKVRLTWQYTRIPTSASSVTFKVMRKTSDDGEWTEYNTVNGDAQPAAGTLLSFTDTDLPANARYQYKVRLTLNDYDYDSAPITAGLLSGSSVKSFSATKGNHDSTVRLSWEAKQVGTDNTTFVISRRYVNSEDEYIRINTTSGTNTLYTYEDNTVQPGYYYEYKIEAYNGSLLQNSLTDAGFCQARGVISGRITFGSGDAVEDVRLTLRPSTTDDNNTVKGYSQRVDGASTGIVWDASEEEVNKVFGQDKDYTVQMFVRPDEGLQEGAVIGEIPGEGRLLLGKQTNGDYELMLQNVTSYVNPVEPTLPASTKVVDLSLLTGDYVAQHCETLTGTLNGNYKISIADGATVYLQDATIRGTNDTAYSWASINCLGDVTIVLEGNNTLKTFYYPAIHIVKDKTLTIKGSGSLKVENSWSYGAACIGGGSHLDCGNIVIEGGNLSLESANSGVCIGSGSSASCGDITITGGSINATVYNALSPAIGAIAGSTCGNITITNTVSKVVTHLYRAGGTKMSDNIGRGISRLDGVTTQCGTITIGGTVYWNGSQYLNNGEEYLTSNAQVAYSGNGAWLADYIIEREGVPGRFTYGSGSSVGVTLPCQTYSLLTITRNGSDLQFQVNNSEAKTLTATKLEHLAPFSIGGAEDITSKQGFKGNFSEVRVWNKSLSDKERESYADRILNGRESGLALYWPMDEGLNHYVFDASYANDAPNGRHAAVGNNIMASNIIPTDNQLSRYAVTNATGEYIIRGIPFVGSGSTYTLLPTRGIHEFNPTSRNGFIGNGSLTLNSYDFTDVSSFPLRGKVTYLNTDIPVDSVQFMIDGNMVQSKDGVRSDSNGEYEISVPIGEHLIECYMNGHRFTSFPIDGTKYNFKKAEIANFVDSTLVNVTGRVNGGFSDLNEPLGFRKSVNRLGKATIKLSLGRESQCSFNYIVDDHGDGNYGTVNLPVESATDSIRSTAYRAALKADHPDNSDTYYIYITTDEKTGEFSAMLPPLRYKVESITFENDRNGDIYNDKPVFAQNLPVIDATNAIKEKMQTDSIEVAGSPTLKYQYSAKMLRQYRSNPALSVVQISPLLSKTVKDVFGEKKIGVTNTDFTVDSVAVANITDNGYNYTFGHPIFVQDKAYTYDIAVAETYKNLDTGETFSEIPKDAVVHIANDASSTTIIYGEDGTVNGEDVKMGEAYQTANIEVTPDETGHIQYEFVAGAPNFAAGHLHNMSIGVAVDGRTTMWQAPDSQTDALDLIVLGSIGSGTNFVTRGPDAVDMIIRRPPGSTSVASLTSKTIRSISHTYVNSSTSGWTGGGYISETPTFELSVGQVMGIATLAKSKYKVVVNQTLKATRNYSDQDIAVNDTTYTVTEQMVTPGSMTIDLSTMTFVPEAGDTYIGRSTNLLFSKGRMLGIYKQDDGTYKLDVKNGVTVGQEFDTKFVFPQAYIENTLIPNWEAIIKSKLEEGYINADHWDKNKALAVPGKVVYYTKYKPGDPEFGKSNGDLSFWTSEQLAATHGYPSYMAVNGTDDPNVPDEVEDAINQIKVWRDRIYDNEKDKLDAFNDESNLIQNYSIATGTKVSMTTETAVKSGTTHKHDFSKSFSVVGQIGETFNDAGVIANLGYSTGWGDSNTDGTGTTISNSVTWTMSDSDPRTALSVDVYKSPTGWGPIFRTRGGQTVNPHEAGSVTKYCQPGTKLNEETMRVENPQLKVIGSSEITDVPTGTEAKFTLQLSNQSETNDICNYVLQVKEGSNPKGAILMIDGTVLSNGKEGRLIKMKGGEELKKTLIVTQSDRSVTDYNDIILQLKSEKDPSIESEQVKLRVHFVPASSPVSLSVDHTVLDQAYKKEKGGIVAKMYDLNRQDKGLHGLRLRYRRKGTDSWTLVKQWATVDSLLSLGYEKMPDGSQFTEKVAFTDDGIYELQAQTFGKYGNDDVTFESNIIEITQDTHGPKVIGMVSPESGQLTYMNRNNMHLRFNEVLNGNALSESGNFRIEGGLNNVVFGESKYPDVAVQLSGERIETEARYDLSNTDYAFDMWFYRQGDGTIISLGTENNLLALSTHDNGMLRARVGEEDDVYETNVQLPANKWMYMALNYKRRTSASEQNRITMLYATAEDNEPNYIGRDVPAKDLSGHGKLGIGGEGMQGMIAELSIWNSDVTATELYETRTMARASYTPGLVGYWDMSEGHGKQITDVARSRHMYMPSESWYINNENRAAHLSGEEGSPLKIDISTFNPSKDDNFAYEMWFRGNEADNTGQAMLMSVLNGSSVNLEEVETPEGEKTMQRILTDHETAIGFEDGKMKLKLIDYRIHDLEPSIPQVKSEVILSERNYCDGNWHHLAFNVRRGTSAIAYIDGEAVKVLPENAVPGFASHYLVIGGELVGGEERNRFAGDVDEIRIWSAALDGRLIGDRMYERMDDSYPGLVGYFPMEEIHRTQQGNVVTDFSMGNFGEKDSQLKIENTASQSTHAPALKPGSTKMRLDDKQFDFIASADEIYFSFPDASLPLMDNNDFVATVNYIKDEHGNNSEPVMWMFHADFASVCWYGDEISPSTAHYKHWDENLEFVVPIKNKTGLPQTYEITGLPSWMTVDEPLGTVEGEEKYVSFHIAPTVPVGRYTEYIYLTDRLGIRRVLQVNLTVQGDEPDWKVNPDLYESNMMLTGQIYIADKISEYTDTKIAAFDDMGLCRGVASPEYVSTRDAYYVNMVVYGASKTELSNGERNLTFKMYDASTGKTYPIVFVDIPGKESSLFMLYAPDAIYGSYDDPVVFRTADVLLQSISLPTGWSWMSIYVDPISTDITDMLPRSKADRKKFQNIKSHDAIASVDLSNASVVGTLKEITPGNMYKVQVSSSVNYDIIGSLINVRNTMATIEPGWNWIGTLSNKVMSVKDAFADLDPVKGDVVKTRTAYATYRGDGTWEGTLKSIVPGVGYIYLSNATETKSFNYPLLASDDGYSAMSKSVWMNESDDLTSEHYTAVNPHLYPDNMNVIAVVKKDGQLTESAEVGAFVNGECRGAIHAESGYYFLTILGSAADDLDAEIEIRVFLDGEEYVVDRMPFVSDAILGTLEDPYVFDIDATAIRSVTTDDEADDAGWYTLHGHKIGHRPTQQGVYIHNGQKVVIKRDLKK